MKTLNIITPHEPIYAFLMFLTISSDYIRQENELVVFVTRQLIDIFIYHTATHNTVNSLSIYIQDISRPRYSLKLTIKPYESQLYILLGKRSHSLVTKDIKALKRRKLT